ncbi:ABC transporter ATP-binding protein [Methylotenera sp. G11]|uniref:ABC transporter ATP-binding protein n=1 Tax=Methylotenera sp. G11 TaxID=1506585 RepID=UPI000647ED19|nr:ABC transporter ATP-binding protein [Methylotenera sp. G11]
MKNNLKKILLILSQEERKRAAILLLLMIFVAFMEVVGVASVVPFLAVLGNPQVIETNTYLAIVYKLLGFSDQYSFLLALGVMTLGLMILTAVVRVGFQYGLARFSSMRIHSIANRLLESYLSQPYSYFLENNSSNMSKTILSEVDEVVKQTFAPMMSFISYSLVSLAIFFLLVVVDSKLAIILSLVFGGFYGLMHLIFRRFLKKIGNERKKENAKRFQIAAEIFGGIKDLKVLGRENAYLSAFRKPSLLYAKHQSTAIILSQLPRYFIEVFVFAAILGIALISLNKDDTNLGQLLPVLGLYAMASMRLKPAMDRIYESLSKMSFGAAALDHILNDLSCNKKRIKQFESESHKISLKKEIQLSGIYFKYSGAHNDSLKDINLTIRAKSSLGVIGATGAGKSTLIDLILGLHVPDKGKIFIDGEPLTEKNTRSWQNSIGYVPQHIFLADDSILSNIAFGVSKDSIDFKASELAAQLAMLDEFILSLPKGYETHIGERGVRLSGGQRQRIGIARALYHNPDLLIFDEATSALDNETEAEVMKAINSISGKKTIIMIAHRLSTLDKCDQVIRLDSGLATIEKRKSI